MGGHTDSLTRNDVLQVLSRLIAAGGHFWLEGGRLRYRGPSGLLTAEDDAFIGERKADVMRAVREAVELRRLGCSAIAPTKPSERTDSRYSDLWQCGSDCGCVFSTAKLSGVLKSWMVN